MPGKIKPEGEHGVDGSVDGVGVGGSNKCIGADSSVETVGVDGRTLMSTSSNGKAGMGTAGSVGFG